MSHEPTMSAQADNWPRPHRLTVHDYYRMAEAGVLSPDDRTELIEGEIIDIPRYVEMARHYGAKLMVDDAHTVGVIGPRGGGSPDYHGCADGIDILMGCMDKAMGGTGGYLCGSKTLVEYLRIAANSSVLSSALPCAMAGAMIAAIDLIESGQELRDGLQSKSQYLKQGLRNAGLTVLGTHDIPSVPLFVGDEALGIAFAEGLRDRGIFCPVMRWPAVPAGGARLRLSLMARHEQSHLDRLIEACIEVAHELGMLDGQSLLLDGRSREAADMPLLDLQRD
jgi:glycine C-acetyltransferase